MSDDAKKVILARRARFLAAAMAGLAADGCGKTTFDASKDAAVDAAPSDTASMPVPPVLEPRLDPPSPNTSTPKPPAPCLRPQVCLKPPAPPPRPCLSPPAPPPNPGGKRDPDDTF